MKELEIRHRCFMDGVDWDCHLGHDVYGAKLYPTEESCREANQCIEKGGCGLVEVEVRLIRWVEEQNLGFE